MDNGVQRFGRVEFDPSRRRLSVAGRAVDLDRPAAAILALILNEFGRDVDKSRLLDAGWPGRVVDENSLAKAICRVRSALGDDGEALKTVHGYGYRLDAEVSSSPGAARPKRIERQLFLVAGMVAVALAIWQWNGWFSVYAAGSDKVINGEPADSVGRILWVDDHPENNFAEERFFKEHKIGVYRARSTSEALTLLRMYAYGAVVSDMGRADDPLAGVELLKRMRSSGDGRPFFLYTVHTSQAQRKLIADSGGQSVAESPQELYRAIFPLFGKTEEAKAGAGSGNRTRAFSLGS